MDDKDFEALKALLGEEFGLSLKTHTRETLLGKLQPRLQALRMSSIKEYLHYLTHNTLSSIEMHDLPSFVMNTESYFLREYAQIELFLDLYKQKSAAAASAAASCVASTASSFFAQPAMTRAARAAARAIFAFMYSYPRVQVGLISRLRPTVRTPELAPRAAVIVRRGF